MSDFIRRLHYSDNLQALREHVKDESVDLVYLDPPFNSKRLYNVYLEAEAQVTAFNDTWSWNNDTEKELSLIADEGPPPLYELLAAFKTMEGEAGIAPYCVMMAARLLELRRVLKPTGSIYLHCDPTASHYLKTVMDAVFGRGNFRNDIVWKRTSAHSKAKKWGAVHDDVLFYTKSDEFTWNEVAFRHDEEYLKKKYSSADKDGRRFQAGDLTAAGVVTDGPSGKPWRGIDPSDKGCHWAIRRTFLNDPEIPENTQEALDYLDSIGRIYWPVKEGGLPRIKRYLDETPGLAPQDVIADIPPVNARAAERLGYPTQKPLALLERFVSASSNPGDLVLDPFCGCGTAVEAAEKLGRQWIGIDVTHLAIALVEKRLEDGFRHKGLSWVTVGTPKDIAAARDLAERDKFQFQFWACSLVRARPAGGVARKGADKGVDGLMLFNDEGPKAKRKKILVSVKGGANVSPSMIRDFRGTIEREGAALGLFITLADPTKAMLAEAAAAGLYMPPGNRSLPVPKIQILLVEDLLNGIGPKLPQDFAGGTITFKRNRPSIAPVDRNPLV
ncbi:MAG: restriction endonuclease [Deltaproteobacteria bacterium]|jgi:site-specific DNA-methyltransferase (adenine-specific)|nr:restriction endonuclease [Deltaproteobacteria bacterium]